MSDEEFNNFMHWLWNTNRTKFVLITLGHMEEADEETLAKWKESEEK